VLYHSATTVEHLPIYIQNKSVLWFFTHLHAI
jgi:hypothetical protein